MSDDASIDVRDRQRDPLRPLAEPEHDDEAGLGGGGDVGGFDLPEEGRIGERFVTDARSTRSVTYGITTSSAATAARSSMSLA